MNSIQACFILGLIIGILGSGFGVYKIEEDKILVMQNEQQKAIITAETDARAKEQQAATISQKVSKDYEDRITAIRAKYAAASKLQNHPNKRVSKVPQSTSGSDETCELAVEQLMDLQEWVNEQVTSFNQ